MQTTGTIYHAAALAVLEERTDLAATLVGLDWGDTPRRLVHFRIGNARGTTLAPGKTEAEVRAAFTLAWPGAVIERVEPERETQ